MVEQITTIAAKKMINPYWKPKNDSYGIVIKFDKENLFDKYGFRSFWTTLDKIRDEMNEIAITM